MTKRSADIQLEKAFKRVSLRDPVSKIISYDSLHKRWWVELQSGKKETRSFKDLSQDSAFENYIHVKMKTQSRTLIIPEYIT
jgi:hypothetical protein